MDARGAETAGAVRAALDLERPEAGELYAIEKYALDVEDSSELQRMREALAEPNLGPGEYKRKRRRLEKQGADEAAAEAREKFYGRLKADDQTPWFDELPKNQKLFGFGLEAELNGDDAEFYYDGKEKFASEKEFEKIEAAIRNFLGDVAPAQYVALNALYLKTEAERAALEKKIDDLDAQGAGAAQTAAEADASVDGAEERIKAIKNEINRQKKGLNDNIKRLDNEFNSRLTGMARTDVFKYVFGKAFAARRRGANELSHGAVVQLGNIRAQAREQHARTERGLPRSVGGRGEAIRRVAGKLNELKEILNFARRVQADKLAADARRKHEAEFAKTMRRAYKAGGTRAIRNKKVLKEIQAELKKEEAGLAKWVAWKRDDPRGKQGDMIRKGKINPPPEYWLLLRTPLVGDFFANTFFVYSNVLNNLALINFKTEMRPWTWKNLIGFLKRGYVQFYMTSTRFKIDAARKALAEGGDLRVTHDPPDTKGSKPAPKAERSTLPVSVRGDLLLAQNTGLYNQNIERYRAVLDSAIKEFYRVGASRTMTQMDKEYIGDLEWKVRLLDVLFLGKGKPPKRGNLYHSETQVGNSDWAEFLARIFGTPQKEGILQEKPDFEGATTYWNDRMAEDELKLIKDALNNPDLDAARKALGLSMKEKQGMRDKDTQAAVSMLNIIRREAAQRLLDLVVPRYAVGPWETKQMQEQDKTLDTADSDGEGMDDGDYGREADVPDAMDVDRDTRAQLREQADAEDVAMGDAEDATKAKEKEEDGGKPPQTFKVQVELAPRGDGPNKGNLDTHGQARVTWRFVRENDDPRHPDYRKGEFVKQERNPMKPWDTVRTTVPARYAPYNSKGSRKKLIKRWANPGPERAREEPKDRVYEKRENNDKRFRKLVGALNKAEKELDDFVVLYGWFAGEDNRQRRQLDDHVKWAEERLAKFLNRNPSYRAKLSDAMRSEHGALNWAPISTHAARAENESVKQLADSIAAKETELNALKAVLERLNAGEERVPMPSKASESDASDVLTDADGKKYRLDKRRNPDTGDVDEEQREYLPADEQSKVYYYDLLGVQKAISELKSELGVLERRMEALQTEGATLPLALPPAMRQPGRGAVGGNVVKWNRPKPEWLSDSRLLEPEEVEARERDKMTREKMEENLDAVMQKRIDDKKTKAAGLKEAEERELAAMQERINKAIEAKEGEARLKAMTAERDAAALRYGKAQLFRHNQIELIGGRMKNADELRKDIEHDFDEKTGANLLPDGVTLDDCLIKTMLQKKGLTYSIKRSAFMEFFEKVVQAIPRNIGAATIESMVETLVSESLKRSRTATTIEPDESVEGTAQHQRTHNATKWNSEYFLVLDNMGLAETDLVYTDDEGSFSAMPDGLEKDVLKETLARRLWRESLQDENGAFDGGRAKRASWDAQEAMGTTFGLESIFSAVGGGKHLRELLDFLCDLGLVRDDPKSDENLFAAKTQLGEYHQRVPSAEGPVDLFVQHEPEELFRAIWIRRQMLSGSEWEEELQARNAREGEVRGVARAQAEQAGQAYYDDHFDAAELNEKVRLAKRAIGRRAVMIPYESNAAEEAAKNAAAQKASLDYERDLRNEGKAKFKEDRNVLKYAKELWLKRVFAKKKHALDRPHGSGFLDLATGYSSAGAAYEPVGYDILARALGQIDAVKSPDLFANLVKTAVHELVKERAAKQAPVPPTAPDPKLKPTAKMLETYQNEMAAYLAQYYAAKQMATKNVFEVDSWVDNASELSHAQLQAKGKAAMGAWVSTTFEKIAKDLLKGALTQQVADALINRSVFDALAESQNDVYRMHYEMDSIEDRRTQALHQQQRVLKSLPAYALIPDIPMGVAKKLFEIASGDLEPQQGTSEVTRDPRTGELVTLTRYREPAKKNARDAAKRAYGEALDAYNKASNTLNGAEREVADKTAPTDLDRKKIEAAKDDVAKRKAEAAELRSAYKLAQAEYEVEADAMIGALFEQEERLRKDGEYKKRKAVYEYGKEKLAEEYAETLVPRVGAGEGDLRSLAERSQKLRKGIVAKQKRFEATRNPDPAEDKKRECREQIAHILAGNVRRKWWNAWLQENPDAGVEPFEMLLLDRGCYEYVQDLIGGFGSYFVEGAFVLKDDESTRELRELATETKQREAYLAWEASEAAETLQERVNKGEELMALSPEEFMYLQGFKIADVASSSGAMEIDTDALAMEIEAHRRGLKRRQEAIEQQRDSLEPQSPKAKTMRTLTEILDGVKKLKQDADVSSGVMQEWLASDDPNKGPVSIIREKIEATNAKLSQKIGEWMFKVGRAEEFFCELEIAKLESRKRKYEQLEKWFGRPTVRTAHELQPNTVYQAKDSIVNTIAELKRQIYYVQAMKDGHANRYTGDGLATYEEVVAAEDPAPGERFRLDQMAREALKASLAELATAKKELAVAKAKLAAVESGGAGPEEVRTAKEMVADAKREVARRKMRGGPAMPAMEDDVQFEPTTLLDQTYRRQEALRETAKNLTDALKKVGDAEARLAEDQTIQHREALEEATRELNEVTTTEKGHPHYHVLKNAGASLESAKAAEVKLHEKIEENDKLESEIKASLDRRLEALKHELAIVGSIYAQTKPDGSVQTIAGFRASKAINPELLPYARLDLGPGIGPKLDLD